MKHTPTDTQQTSGNQISTAEGADTPDKESQSILTPYTNRRSLMKAVGPIMISAGLSGMATADSSQSSSLSSGSGISLRRIDENEEKGFNFPYYLYAPENSRDKPLLVETVNSGGCDDDFQVDLEFARETAEFGVARRISDELRVPLIVPVFANPCEGDFWERFIQSLDTETMHINSGEFERIDLQLLAIVDDAQERLADHGIDVPSEVMLNGFSASGDFVNNFAALHPDRVASVTAGAVNGMVTLPIEQYDGYTLDYQIGVADLEELTGEPFDEDAWKSMPQLCYMGETEQPPEDDTLPYQDVWSEQEAEKAEAVYGEVMQTDRMTLCEMIYHEADATARFEVYDGVGHDYSDLIEDDIIAFHARHNGIDIESVDSGSDGSDHRQSQDADRTLSSCGNDATQEHDEVSVSFAERPTIDTESVEIEYDVAGSFGMQVVARMFSETGSAQWGFELEWIDAGESGIGSYEFSKQAMTLGETLEVKAFPEDWRNLDDAIASDCMVVSGVRFVDTPIVGDNEFSIEYVYPEDANPSGEVIIEVDGEEIDSITDIDPGTFEKQTVSIPDEEGTPPEANIVLRLTDTDADELISEQSKTTNPTGTADVSFATQPVANEQTLPLEYQLDSNYDVNRFAALRLYTNHSSSWGIYINKVEPGNEGIQEFEITADEPGIPLSEGDELTVALVDGNDPYAQSPLATASATVGSEDEGDTEDIETYESDSNGAEDEDENEETDVDDQDEDENEETDVDDQDEDGRDTDDMVEHSDNTDGFGIVAGISALGGVGYALKRRLETTKK